ncbi:FxsB family radical SAM/SPASM domain protein [Nocardia panacis]|uniref:FxsB family radical SAM/SPASM domain protein n=2 Tax=Nocardia panacis TaxID=2340916 RepID=A0A3A4L108_9NOCA|nr:FxsB family radical SAM/SPASM domain protein [Nocardia panacis]
MARWPESGLDTAALRRDGWAPLPFREFVVKIHSRCNLACDYCYMYEMADQSWRDQPKTMSRKAFADACRTIADHARRGRVPEVALVFHGGEPLMAGHRELEFFARHAREVLEPITKVRLGMQTNGVLIDAEFLRICADSDIRIGVSLDGDEADNDRHRRDRRGQGSFAKVAAGIARLRAMEYRHLFSGLLSTIDIANDPVRTYEALLRFHPPAVDFLLPHGNWTTPPPGLAIDGTETPYADWLIPIFDRWYSAPELGTKIRLFDDIIDLLFGGAPGSESVGLQPVRLAVFETDGSLEQVDELKSTFAGATKIRLDGHDNALDEAMHQPAIVARQIGAQALSDECRACPIHTVCGGGHYAHRYRAESGFRNRSVYCADLTRLIRHIEDRIRTDLGAASRR